MEDSGLESAIIEADRNPTGLLSPYQTTYHISKHLSNHHIQHICHIWIANYTLFVPICQVFMLRIIIDNFGRFLIVFVMFCLKIVQIKKEWFDIVVFYIGVLESVFFFTLRKIVNFAKGTACCFGIVICDLQFVGGKGEELTQTNNLSNRYKTIP